METHADRRREIKYTFSVRVILNNLGPTSPIKRARGTLRTCFTMKLNQWFVRRGFGADLIPVLHVIKARGEEVSRRCHYARTYRLLSKSEQCYEQLNMYLQYKYTYILLLYFNSKEGALRRNAIYIYGSSGCCWFKQIRRVPSYLHRTAIRFPNSRQL